MRRREKKKRGGGGRNVLPNVLPIHTLAGYRYPTGMELLEFANGQTEKNHADGTQEIGCAPPRVHVALRRRSSRTAVAFA